MKLIVGLGNPGKKYEETRHNVGFMVLDKLAKKLNFSFEKKFNSEFKKERETIYLKPQTFMNLSGQVVKEVAHYYNIDNGNIWIIYDDIDIPLGDWKEKHEGTSAGHKGIDSIIQELGTDEFARLRVGIGRLTIDANEDRKKIVENYVLNKFTPEQIIEIDKVIQSLVEEFIIPKLISNQNGR